MVFLCGHRWATVFDLHASDHNNVLAGGLNEPEADMTDAWSSHGHHWQHVGVGQLILLVRVPRPPLALRLAPASAGGVGPRAYSSLAR